MQKALTGPHTASKAFDQLKQLLVSPPILAYLRFETPLRSTQMRQIMLLVEPSARFRMVRNKLLHTSVGNWGRLSRTTPQLRGKH